MLSVHRTPSNAFLRQHGAAIRREGALTSSQLSTGTRISRASVDPAGLGIANRLRADTSALRVAHRNIGEATSMLQVAEDGLNDIYSALERMKELAVRARSSNSEGQMTAIRVEYSELRDEINRIVAS